MRGYADPVKQLVTYLIAATVIAGGALAQDTRVLRTPEYRALQRRLCQGWNTWSANSVLSHVYLPDGFALTLGLKSAGMGHHYQSEFFQVNATARRAEKIRLGPHTDDGAYTELRLEFNSGSTAGSNNVAVIESAAEGGEEYILLTVEKRAALRPEHLIVETGYYWNRAGTVRREGAVLKAQSARAGGRTFEVRTTAADAADPFLTVDGPYLSMAMEGRFAIYTGARKTLEEVAGIVEAHRAAHEKRLAGYGAAKEVFTAMQTILGWNLTYDPENDRAISPVSRMWSANWGGKCCSIGTRTSLRSCTVCTTRIWRLRMRWR